MRKKKVREPQEGVIGGGWTVDDDAAADASPGAPGTTEAPAGLGTVGTVDSSGAELSEDATAQTAELADGSDESAGFAGSAREQFGNGALVVLGLFGGLYVIYTWVWITWAQYYAGLNALSAAGSGSIGGVLQQIVYWSAPVAPALWFLCSVLACRRDTRLLTLLLTIGGIALIPLPMFLQGVAV